MLVSTEDYLRWRLRRMSDDRRESEHAHQDDDADEKDIKSCHKDNCG
jgi:hypothetical protein